MASHGVPRQSSSAPRSEKARQKELREIEEYKDLTDQVTKCMNEKAYTNDTLDLTSRLLIKNPEYYTVWNHRRRILNHLLPSEQHASSNTDSDSDSNTHQTQQIESFITGDLEFLFPLLVKFPKCYWIWNHRLWLLQQASARLPASRAQRFWKHELSLVGKMLAADNRNFHGWGYRRTVIAALRTFPEHEHEHAHDTRAEPSLQPSPPPTPAEQSLTEQEFAYTTKMVRANLSNFSAWHNRSKLLPRLLAERAAAAPARRALFAAELAFVADALSMDPNDQSLWFYHQFLMACLAAPVAGDDADAGAPSCFGFFAPADRRAVLAQQIALFREVLDDYDDCKWIYQHLLRFAELHNAEAAAGEDDGAPVGDAEMRAWLTRLRQLDPLREGRWRDMERRL